MSFHLRHIYTYALTYEIKNLAIQIKMENHERLQTNENCIKYVAERILKILKFNWSK